MTKSRFRIAAGFWALFCALLLGAPDVGAEGMRTSLPAVADQALAGAHPIVVADLSAESHPANRLRASEFAPGRTGWLSRDPLGEEGGLNLYAFVDNDPVNSYDYLGLLTGSEILKMDKGARIPSLVDPTFRHSQLALQGLLLELPYDARSILLETDYRMGVDFWLALGAIADGEVPAMFRPHSEPDPEPEAPRRGMVRFLNNLNAFFEGTGISGTFRAMDPYAPGGLSQKFADNPLSGAMIGMVALTQDGEQTGLAIREGLSSEKGRYALAGGVFGAILTRKLPGDPSFSTPRQFQTPFDPLTRKHRLALREKLDNRTLTRQEWEHLEWNRRFNNRRNRGVSRFWSQERLRLRAGEGGTRDWTVDQREAILLGRTPEFKGEPIEGHHMYNALDHPHLADDPTLIYPATADEHFFRWHGGNWRNDTLGTPLDHLFLEQF